MIKIVVIGIIVLVVAFGIYESLPSIAKSNGQEDYGISVHNLNLTDVKLVKNLGVTWVRSDVGSYNWNNVYVYAELNNLDILGILDYASVPHNFTLQQWNQSVRQYAIQYPNVNAWEIWNEPIATYSYDGYQNGSPINYFNMVKSAYELIKSVNSKAEIVALGGFYPTYNDISWINDLISLGIGKYSNAISLHLYPFAVGNNTDLALQTYEGIISGIKALTSESIWVTETGTIQSEQTNYIPIIYGNLIKDGITHIFWYDLYHTGGSIYNTALIQTNGQPSAGYYELQKYIGG